MKKKFLVLKEIFSGQRPLQSFVMELVNKEGYSVEEAESKAIEEDETIDLEQSDNLYEEIGTIEAISKEEAYEIYREEQKELYFFKEQLKFIEIV